MGAERAVGAMTPYRSAPLTRRAPPTSWWRLARRWALDALAHVFIGRPRLGPYILVRALSRVSHEERVRYAYETIGHPFATPVRSPESQLRMSFVAAMAEKRAQGYGFKWRYRRALCFRHWYCQSADIGPPFEG